jgi:hypothetical protein
MMRIRQTFFITFSLFLLVWGFFAYTSEYPKPTVEQIDRQIEELEQIKRGYLSKANRYRDQEERLQFQDRSSLESRRFSELAQENEEKAQRAQMEIDRLTQEREILLQKKK